MRSKRTRQIHWDTSARSWVPEWNRDVSGLFSVNFLASSGACWLPSLPTSMLKGDLPHFRGPGWVCKFRPESQVEDPAIQFYRGALRFRYITDSLVRTRREDSINDWQLLISSATALLLPFPPSPSPPHSSLLLLSSL